MKLTYAAVATLIFLPLLFLDLAERRSPNTEPVKDRSEAGQRVVVVELFTSEGCSSCPPADALLKLLSERQPVPGTEIIALEEHVDYWNHLGWKDPFSSPEFSERQNQYARVFGNNGVYTPQMVVDGHTEFVGSRSREAQGVIERAAAQPKLAIQLTPKSPPANGVASFDIKVSGLLQIPSAHQPELWIAITEKGLHSDVKAGENSGEDLQHAAVVRTLFKSNSLSASSDYQTHVSAKIDPSWRLENLAFVAFVEEKSSRKIIGAASTKF
jgi:hypothetical protein